MIRKSIRFFGIVQGVGFRYTALRAAKARGCSGWIRNELDGSVTMEIQGTREQINEVVCELDEDRYIRIEAMDVNFIDVVEGEKGFRTAW